MNFDINNLAWEKMAGLLPAIVQDSQNKEILMLGYMNQAALQKTLETQWLTFYSRSKQRLWTKGETSGNKLKLITITADCDQDTLLISAQATGPTCHQGTTTCFDNDDFLYQLEHIIKFRAETSAANSYTVELLASGISRIAQKVGEEAIEVVLAAIEKDDQQFCGELADLLYHILVLLKARNLPLVRVIETLRHRMKKVD